MEKEYDSYDRDEDLDHPEGLPGVGHVQEYAENVDGEQGNDDHFNSFDNDLLELFGKFLEVRRPEKGHSQSEGEGKNQ